MLLHNLKKLYEYPRARPDKNLPLSPLLCVVDVLKSIGQHTHANHGLRDEETHNKENEGRLGTMWKCGAIVASMREG